MESIQFKMGKKAQTGRVLWGKQRRNKMEGTKYTQHKQSDNITCIKSASHIRSIRARLPDQSYTLSHEIKLMFHIAFNGLVKVQYRVKGDDPSFCFRI